MADRRSRRAAIRRRRRRRAVPLAVALTPMIDVVFLLLLYFLLAADLRDPEAMFRLDLVREAQETTEKDPFALPPRPITVDVRSTGPGRDEYTLRVEWERTESPRAFDELAAQLRAARGDFLTPGQIFIVRAGAETRWEHALGALNAVSRAGFTRVRLERTES